LALFHRVAARSTAPLSGQQIQVEAAILNGVEYLLAIIAALRHVMRDAGNDDASTSRHNLKSLAGACNLMENASEIYQVLASRRNPSATTAG